jgi:uncharacterized protein (TIGR01777 family)
MKVIITGGTGLIGSALAQDLHKAGHEVILLSRGTRQCKEHPNGISLNRWDGKTTHGWAALVDGTDAIINLAGENLSSGRWTPRRKQAIIDSRVNAGMAIVQAIRQARRKPGVLIQISGVGAYGTSETAMFDESAPYGNDFLAEVSRKWEASTRMAETMGVRRVVVRSGVVLSTQAGALPRMLLPFRFFAGGQLGSGQQWMSWVHLKDAARAMSFLIDNRQAQGVFNLSATPITNRQFSRLIGKVMRRPVFFTLPAFIIRLIFGEMAVVVLEGQRVSSQRLKKLGFKYHFSESESALKDLLQR